MPILIAVTKEVDQPYKLFAIHMVQRTLRNYGIAAIPEDVDVVDDVELLVNHVTLKSTLIIPTAEQSEARLRNAMAVRHPGEPGQFPIGETFLNEFPGKAWAITHNIADYPRGIKTFLKHCTYIDF